MGRKRIQAEPLTNAEKQARYRASQKAKLEALKAATERIAAKRKRGRELAKKADQNYTHGRTVGICNSAAFLAGKDRADIARAILSHFCVDRETAEAALQTDKRTKSITLESLDKSGAWGKSPWIIK